MHYAVPRILHQNGILERLYTDLCAVEGWPRALRWLPRGICPSPLARLSDRVPAGVPRSTIASFPGFGLRYAWKRASIRSLQEYTAVHLWAGTVFCEAVIRSGLGNARGVYTFNSAGLELLRHARERGLRTVVEQTIAPIPVEDQLLLRERRAFPDWEPSPAANPLRALAASRERSEWEAAGIVLCGSEFVRDGIRAAGGPAGRCHVVPYGVAAPPGAALRRRGRRPLRVLTAGEAGLRKGAPYLLAAARTLGASAQFRWVGSITVSRGALRARSGGVEFTGAVPPSRIAEHYAWADVFVLPSICEGSAAVCYEALAAGLPVIATPNCGSVVRDGLDGFIVPIRDPGAIAAAIERFLSDPALLAAMSAAALKTAAGFTLEKYAGRLLAALATKPA
jgi:glycosyltransferase involved in cell wall biosynthesis